METDDGVTLEPIDILTSTITVSSETTATSNELALNDTPLSSIHDSKDIFSLSSKGKGSQKPPLRFEKPFLAAHSVYTKSQPHPDQDLIVQYGLTWLATTVARTDPVTGEKINKIRKSYEGQIKAFGLAGRNKAMKWDSSQGPSIAQLALAPAEDYENARVAGKEVWRGLSSSAQSRLQKISELIPGPVPRNAEWENALGIDKTKGVPDDAKIKKQEIPRDVTSVNNKAHIHLNGTTVASKDSDPNRPKRAGRKRRYNDESFEGYGEGYDDEADGSSEGSRRSMSSRHKRQKNGPFGFPG